MHVRAKHQPRDVFCQVRIYKVRQVSLKSKKWIADQKNRMCDAPGSWYCVGQYPPALKSFISKRRDFKQLVSFATNLSALRPPQLSHPTVTGAQQAVPHVPTLTPRARSRLAGGFQCEERRTLKEVPRGIHASYGRWRCA